MFECVPGVCLCVSGVCVSGVSVSGVCVSGVSSVCMCAQYSPFSSKLKINNFDNGIKTLKTKNTMLRNWGGQKRRRRGEKERKEGAEKKDYSFSSL